MNSIIATHLRLAKTAKTTSTAVRLMHASAVLQAGRKKKGPIRQVTSSERKVHAALYEQEDQENDIEQLQEWENDDHHVYGHLLMESIRDVRKYARQMKFEHPALAEYKKPFRAPSESQILEFESSATMGEKSQANDRKVLLRVKVSKLGLSAPELHKFVLLAESRYNPQKDELKMSESREVSSLLNKKRLADTLAELITEAKKKDDSFTDVPLDFVHYKYKPKLMFPKSWNPEAKPKTSKSAS
ncbi:37S ribosomal protein S24, mitochondrial [Coemansia sp. RSA 1813]|nr:37S ribosomal protein S24, mitochondrial [Coemansia sp. RSA 1646]KAJ1771326.1 37S ribosomal protein S24, mitochondrial [Coemansia sp. RSA 1843]KAJ2088980.1 37S ribosomal protein S24, mitochondrial [Coemansia sp. RSA 986]KAJ2213212.1 37S ribosomal protein S24, mitochondrial [Coemansia sp. RSA 487]KAJ2569478.1 37S ribosomal protein S24, mitochondrial [Coemansia sp. RSA 1813]